MCLMRVSPTANHGRTRHLIHEDTSSPRQCTAAFYDA